MSKPQGSRRCRYKRAAVSLAWVLLVAVGCGEDRGLVPVYGRVTFDGQEMPADGSIRFVPLRTDDGFPNRSGTARFEKNGEYQAKSFQPNDGLYPGEYAAFVKCWEVPPVMGGPPAKSYMPQKYDNKREPVLRVVVSGDVSSINFDIDIESE